MKPRFSELNKVRVTQKEFRNTCGYVIGSQFRNDRWVYKISFPDPDDPKELKTWDNWIPEDWLEAVK